MWVLGGVAANLVVCAHSSASHLLWDDALSALALSLPPPPHTHTTRKLFTLRGAADPTIGCRIVGTREGREREEKGRQERVGKEGGREGGRERERQKLKRGNVAIRRRRPRICPSFFPHSFALSLSLSPSPHNTDMQGNTWARLRDSCGIHAT